MTREIDKLHARIRELEDEVSRVRAEAVEAVEFWGEFASNYSKVKHGLAEDIASLRGIPPAASAWRVPSEVPK